MFSRLLIAQATPVAADRLLRSDQTGLDVDFVAAAGGPGGPTTNDLRSSRTQVEELEHVGNGNGAGTSLTPAAISGSSPSRGSSALQPTRPTKSAAAPPSPAVSGSKPKRSTPSSAASTAATEDGHGRSVSSAGRNREGAAEADGGRESSDQQKEEFSQKEPPSEDPGGRAASNSASGLQNAAEQASARAADADTDRRSRTVEAVEEDRAGSPRQQATISQKRPARDVSSRPEDTTASAYHGDARLEESFDEREQGFLLDEGQQDHDHTAVEAHHRAKRSEPVSAPQTAAAESPSSGQAREERQRNHEKQTQSGDPEMFVSSTQDNVVNVAPDADFLDVHEDSPSDPEGNPQHAMPPGAVKQKDIERASASAPPKTSPPRTRRSTTGPTDSVNDRAPAQRQLVEAGSATAATNTAWDVCGTTESPFCFSSGYHYVKENASGTGSRPWVPSGGQPVCPNGHSPIENPDECKMAVSYLAAAGKFSDLQATPDDPPTVFHHKTDCVKTGATCSQQTVGSVQDWYPMGCGVIKEQSGDVKNAIFYMPSNSSESEVETSDRPVLDSREWNAVVCRVDAHQSGWTVREMTSARNRQAWLPPSSTLQDPFGDAFAGSGNDPVSQRPIGQFSDTLGNSVIAERSHQGVTRNFCRQQVGTYTGFDLGAAGPTQVHYAQFWVTSSTDQTGECRTYAHYFESQTSTVSSPDSGAQLQFSWAWVKPEGGCGLDWIENKMFFPAFLSSKDTTQELFDHEWPRVYWGYEDRINCEIACMEKWQEYPHAPLQDRKLLQGCSYQITKTVSGPTTTYRSKCYIHPRPEFKGAGSDANIRWFFAPLPLARPDAGFVNMFANPAVEAAQHFPVPNTACGHTFDTASNEATVVVDRSSALFETWEYSSKLGAAAYWPALSVAHIPYVVLARGFQGCPWHFNTPTQAECSVLEQWYDGASRLHGGGALQNELPGPDQTGITVEALTGPAAAPALEDCGLRLENSEYKWSYKSRDGSPVAEIAAEKTELIKDAWRVCMATCGTHSASFFPYQSGDTNADYTEAQENKCVNSTSVTAGVYHGAKNSTTIGNNYEQCCTRKTQCADLFDLSYCEELFGLGNVPVHDADTVACDPDALSCKESHKETCCFGATLCVDFFDVLRCYDTCGPNMVPIVDDTVTCKTDAALCQNHPDNDTCCQIEVAAAIEHALEAGIDWTKAVLMYGGALLAVFVLGVVVAILMRADPLDEFNANQKALQQAAKAAAEEDTEDDEAEG